MKSFLYCSSIIFKHKLTGSPSKYDKVFACRYGSLAVSLLILFSPFTFFNVEWIKAVQQDATSTSQFLTYHDPTYGVKILYPSNWTIDKKQPSNYDDVTKIVGFIKDPNSLAGDFLISVHNLTSMYVNRTIGLAELLNRTVDYYSGYYDDFNLIESNYNASFNSSPNSTYRLVWVDKEGQYTIKTMQTGIIIGDQAYLVRYYAELGEYSDNLPLIEEMIYSLEVNNESSHYQ